MIDFVTKCVLCVGLWSGAALAQGAEGDEVFILDLSHHQNLQDGVLSLKRELVEQHQVDLESLSLVELHLTARSEQGRGRAGLKLPGTATEPVAYQRFGSSWTTRTWKVEAELGSDTEEAGPWYVLSQGTFDFLEAKVLLRQLQPVRDCPQFSRLARQEVLRSPYPHFWELAKSREVCTSTALQAFTEARYAWYNENVLAQATRVNSFWSLRAFRSILRLPRYLEWQTHWASQVNNRWAWQSFHLLADAGHWEWELRWATEAHTRSEWEEVRGLYASGRYSEWELRQAVLRDDL